MRVLLCDDDASVREFLTASFEVDGWDVDAVESGEQCLEQLAQRLPDALVIDQLMPGLHGTQVADQLRADGFDRPIVLCSAHLGPQFQEDIDRLGLIGVNKIDVQAVIRITRAAVLERPTAPRRRRQVWPD
ncbi:MAG: response regulator with CheY-like receiver domain protein and winged-helix DNA-binding domain [Frankiales bacterium]|jgi:CheY-like chemotaxis protein|nr:response regulator with CheY-like receiver domain protein and winged-helix DNA-binding domain [Frankiales bacterium]